MSKLSISACLSVFTVTSQADSTDSSAVWKAQVLTVSVCACLYLFVSVYSRLSVCLYIHYLHLLNLRTDWDFSVSKQMALYMGEATRISRLCEITWVTWSLSIISFCHSLIPFRTCLEIQRGKNNQILTTNPPLNPMVCLWLCVSEWSDAIRIHVLCKCDVNTVSETSF